MRQTVARERGGGTGRGTGTGADGAGGHVMGHNDGARRVGGTGEVIFEAVCTRKLFWRDYFGGMGRIVYGSLITFPRYL